MTRIKRLASSAVARITNWRPLNAALALMSYSLVVIVLAAAVDTWKHERHLGGVTQQVGYSQTLNWAWAFTLIFPFFAFFLLESARAAESIPDRLAAARMLLDSTGEPHDRAATLAAARWTIIKKEHAYWWLIIAVAGLVESLWEWATYSLVPLIEMRLPPEGEVDWSVKFFEDPSIAQRAVNAGFSFIVFLQQAVLIAAIGFLFYLMLSVAAFLSDLRSRGRPIRLAPSLSRCGKDPRLGFEELVPFAVPLLFSVLLLYLHLFCSRVWNAYLHPAVGESASGSVWELVRGPLMRGLNDREVEETIVERVVEFAQGIGATNYSGLAVSLGGVVLLFVCGLFLFYSMRKTAQEARLDMLSMAKTTSEKKCLEAMAVWPLKYPGTLSLLALVFLGALSMLAFRLGIYFVGALLAFALPLALIQLARK